MTKLIIKSRYKPKTKTKSEIIVQETNLSNPITTILQDFKNKLLSKIQKYIQVKYP